jgi:hypothetical protein
LTHGQIRGLNRRPLHEQHDTWGAGSQEEAITCGPARALSTHLAQISEANEQLVEKSVELERTKVPHSQGGLEHLIFHDPLLSTRHWNMIAV